jgi:hypothetical protein
MVKGIDQIYEIPEGESVFAPQWVRGFAVLIDRRDRDLEFIEPIGAI